MAKAKTSKSMSSKRRRRVPSDEQRVDLTLWHKDRMPAVCDGNGEALPMVEVGCTDSERGLGFALRVMQPGVEPVLFVLDREQVARLHTYLEAQLTRIVAD
jgi:hypothetical protein